MHLLGNSLIEFDGPNIAHVETYLNAYHQASEMHHWKGSFVKLWARYLDRFEQREGLWLIARRRLLVDWMYSTLLKAGSTIIPTPRGGSRTEPNPTFIRSPASTGPRLP